MDEDSWDYARGKVAGPAIALMVTSAFCIMLLLLGLAFDAWLLSGAAREMARPGRESQETAITVRIAWSILMLVANGAILAGAVRMKGLRNLGFSRTTCILALIPCIGPCFLLGIPFGIWGLVVLKDPRVQTVFEG